MYFNIWFFILCINITGGIKEIENFFIVKLRRKRRPKKKKEVYYVRKEFLQRLINMCVACAEGSKYPPYAKSFNKGCCEKHELTMTVAWQTEQLQICTSYCYATLKINSFLHTVRLKRTACSHPGPPDTFCFVGWVGCTLLQALRTHTTCSTSTTPFLIFSLLP